jgi:hypothetical protein
MKLKRHKRLHGEDFYTLTGYDAVMKDRLMSEVRR